MRWLKGRGGRAPALLAAAAVCAALAGPARGGVPPGTATDSTPEAAEAWPVAAVGSDGHQAPYTPLAHAARPWRLCALLPGTQDKFWWGVSWGLAHEAERLGVTIGIYQAGGYDRLDVQKAQLQACRGLKADAYILSAISTDGLDGDIAAIADHHQPLVDLINGVGSPYVSAHILSNFHENGRFGAEYILDHRAAWERASGHPLKVGWLPGPDGVEWANAMEISALAILRRAGVAVVHGGYGPTALTAQMDLVRALFEREPDLDVVFGNAVAIQAAANFLRSRHNTTTRLVATYSTGTVIDLIRDGAVDLAASDSPILQARVAVDLAVRALEGKPHGVWNVMAVDRLDRDHLAGYDLSRVAVPDGDRFQLRPLPPPGQSLASPRLGS